MDSVVASRCELYPPRAVGASPTHEPRITNHESRITNHERRPTILLTRIPHRAHGTLMRQNRPAAYASEAPYVQQLVEQPNPDVVDGARPGRGRSGRGGTGGVFVPERGVDTAAPRSAEGAVGR